MQAVLKLWPYSVELVRPVQYSLLDQTITALMKVPPIVCYVERIVSRFLQDASQCHMSTFAFDEKAYIFWYSVLRASYIPKDKQTLPFRCTINRSQRGRTE